jgi:hypothetical protein
MRKIFAVGLICLVAACGANGDPLKPTAKLGFGIGPGGITPRISLGAQGSNVGLGIGAGGASISANQGPVAVSVGL